MESDWKSYVPAPATVIVAEFPAFRLFGVAWVTVPVMFKPAPFNVGVEPFRLRVPPTFQVPGPITWPEFQVLVPLVVRLAASETLPFQPLLNATAVTDCATSTTTDGAPGSNWA